MSEYNAAAGLRIDRANLANLRAMKREVDEQSEQLEIAIAALERTIERESGDLREMRLDGNRSRRLAELSENPALLALIQAAVTIFPMGTAATSPLAPTLSTEDRNAALAAIAKAEKYQFIGIRPREARTRTLALILLKCRPAHPEPDQLIELGGAIGKAQIAWPLQTEYEIVGSNSCRERDARDFPPGAATSILYDAAVLGCFDVGEPELSSTKRS